MKIIPESDIHDNLLNSKLIEISRYVKSILGGDVFSYDDQALYAVVLKWENPNLINTELHFTYKIPYSELIEMENPIVWGEAIVEKVLTFLEGKT